MDSTLDHMVFFLLFLSLLMFRYYIDRNDHLPFVLHRPESAEMEKTYQQQQNEDSILNRISNRDKIVSRQMNFYIPLFQ